MGDCFTVAMKSDFFLCSFVFLSVAIMLKDDYFVRGAGLPGRFKAEKVEFHWGPSNGSEGSEHSINGRRYPVEVNTMPQMSEVLREREIGMLTAGMSTRAVAHELNVHFSTISQKETFLEPFVLKDLLPSSLGSYYRYTGSLTTPPCSKVVEWIIFSRPVYVSYKQCTSVLGFRHLHCLDIKAFPNDRGWSLWSDHCFPLGRDF
uniref:Alpha-carbonic anhydrase domain-containing protein n=1 Tax=Monopterus albus TaxID=43700 RepID=A0A3Q3R956_MONAL